MFDFLNDASTVIGLIIGTLLGAEISRYLYKPNVIIKFKDISPLFSDNGFFASILVANKGRTASIGTQGKITLNYNEERLMNPSEFKLDAFENSLPTYRIENIKMDYPRHQLITPEKNRTIKNSSLCWSTLGNPDKVDINPGASETLDIFRAQRYVDEISNRVFWYLIFPCEQGWKKVRCRIMLEPNDIITGKLFVCPGNVFPTVRKIIITLDKNAEKPSLSIKNYNFFNRIYHFFNRIYHFFNRSDFYFD
ncbi:hypothetical protein LJC68_08105 [Bacteroidales bacterium OttesenSCG-928-B11]|nr:hypothetical protein [Bacteroidales bacterium OttesenSCG-928-B11]MDL2326484.1 hypothetical protein [Bacteroidales bacterium OttesenSCG-928-A14]